MDTERKMQFYEMFEDLLQTVTTFGSPNREKIKQCTISFCKFFGFSRGTTEFYRSISYEKMKQGEVFTDYDTGEPSVPAVSLRYITPSMAVIKGSLWQPEDAEPLPQDERDKAELVMRVYLSFLSRIRLMGVLDRFGFHDDFGYRNLRSFFRYLETLSEKNSLSGHTAMHFNLRHFGLVNQKIGRVAGDRVMREYFNLIERTIGGDGILCRVGGDNFVGIFNTDVTDKILEILKGTPMVYEQGGDNRIMITASAGLFRIPEGYAYETPGDIMDMVNTASHTAKVGGQDNVVFFDDNEVMKKEKRQHIQQLFSTALEKEEFKVFYQPKIDITTGNIVGAEALCRWFRDGKIVPPMEFIPVLELSSDICRLDFYMLDHVCQHIRRWLDDGRNAVRVSVNLSRKHMLDVDLLEHIIEIIDRHKVPHQYIEIELTETTTDVEFRDLKRVVRGLQQAGIYTSVDDFGMGYSSLNLIREIPWDVLKVDRSFLPVDEEESGSIRNIMFKYVVAMANELGLECIAEGVETQKQVKVLQENKCLLAQGYYFDKPLPLEEFEDRLNKHGYTV